MTHQTGITTDGIPVVPIFELVSTHGIPLEVAVVHSFNAPTPYIIDWHEFLTRAKDEGWNMKKLILRVYNVLYDVKGSDYAERWREHVNGQTISD